MRLEFAAGVLHLLRARLAAPQARCARVSGGAGEGDLDVKTIVMQAINNGIVKCLQKAIGCARRRWGVRLVVARGVGGGATRRGSYPSSCNIIGFVGVSVIFCLFPATSSRRRCQCARTCCSRSIDCILHPWPMRFLVCAHRFVFCFSLGLCLISPLQLWP